MVVMPLPDFFHKNILLAKTLDDWENYSGFLF
jgi:hypothetical protein